MKKRIIRNIVIFPSLLVLLFSLSSSTLKKKKPQDLLKITKNKIEYNSGTIYIGDERYLKKIKELNPYDVLVIDDREAEDPNLRILDSCKIKDPEIREEIIDALLAYERKYESDWDRSRATLIREWYIHNLMYEFGYKTHRTSDVDLNNADEKTYSIRRNLLNQ